MMVLLKKTLLNMRFHNERNRMIQSKKQSKKIGREAKQAFMVAGAYLLILIFFSLRSPYFFTFKNIASMLIAAVPLGFIAIGECICLITGNFDMSSGMVASMAGVIWASLITKCNMGVWIALAIAIAFGALAGWIAGLLVAYLDLPAFIVTYALMLVWRGVIFVMTGGEAIKMSQNADFKIIGQTKLFGTPVTLPVLLMVIAFVAVTILLRYTVFGRHLYIIGGNKEAAKNIGIYIKRSICITFVISGLVSAVAGVLWASRSASAQSIIGETYAMQAIAATVVGGAKMTGGKASMGMTFVGVLIIIAISNGLNMMGIDSFYQYIATGLIVFVSVLIQTERHAL